MPKKKLKINKPLNWEYCECGCHCHTVVLNGQTYSHLLTWKYDKDNKPDYNKEEHYLMVGFDYVWKQFKSGKEIDVFVKKDALKRINFLG